MAKHQQTWVVKVGSSLLAQDVQQGKLLNEELINSLMVEFTQLRKANKQIILVSSGSVAFGRHKLGFAGADNRQLQDIQSAAAVGQTGLIGAYERIMGEHGIVAAQLLLTHYDFQRRKSYLNTRTCLSRLLELGTLPIINENDTLMDEEVCFGDNDTLAAMAANLISADLLIILTDIDGLYTANPRYDAEAKLIKEIKAEDESLMQIATAESGGLGKGGMLTKVTAAQLAARAGATTIIAKGDSPGILNSILQGDNPGTKITSERGPSVARKRWLAGQLMPLGKLHLDSGAVTALRDKGVSLLPIGVTSVVGKFERGDPVSCCDEKDKEIARGLVNYSNQECNKIKRLPSGKIGSVLGYEYEPELIHRDNLALLV